MNDIRIIQDKKLRRKQPQGRFTYEFLQINPITKEEKWVKAGPGHTYLNTILSSYVKYFINFKFKATRNAVLEIPYGYRVIVEKQIEAYRK